MYGSAIECDEATVLMVLDKYVGSESRTASLLGSKSVPNFLRKASSMKKGVLCPWKACCCWKTAMIMTARQKEETPP